MATYFFARVNMHMRPDYIAKMEYLYFILVDSRPIVYRRDNYRAIDLQVRKVGDKSYLTGLVIKYAPEQAQQTVGENNQIEDVILKNLLLAKVRFIYDANESLLIYEEDRSHIPRESFLERFSTILSESNVQGIPIKLVPITETYTFLDRLNEMKEIKKITISLQPSNPNNRDRWKKIDEKLKLDNITNYKEVQENKKPGESVKVDEETTAKIMMGEDGYGEAKAEGFDAKGDRITIVTTNKDVQAKAIIQGQDNIEQEIEALQIKTNELKIKPGGEDQS